MSTNDVPGANPVNADVLAMGCWAEHEDGSLIFVQSVEGGRAIYSMFDLSKDPILEYRDAMSVMSFEKTFSWKPKDKNSIKWTWHDKTPFPWDRVIKAGATDGQKYASASDLLTAAERVANDLQLRAEAVAKHKYEHNLPTQPVARIRDKLARALSELRK